MSQVFPLTVVMGNTKRQRREISIASAFQYTPQGAAHRNKGRKKQHSMIRITKKEPTRPKSSKKHKGKILVNL
jgi:hypothetical protein